MAEANDGDGNAARGGEQPNGAGGDELLEQWGRRLGGVVGVVSAAAARAREEAEDILAEAQSIRRGERA